ncbi:MAG: peptide-methionine (S)-S-oxide reductase MsrA [Hyphomicrobiales bacterium]
MAKAMFGAGCFWGVETAFRAIDGVGDVAVGYAGGTTDNPAYRDVWTGSTGHAEVGEVKFDPAKVDYETLLDRFWAMHDPTQVNRQGPDFGTQYRSVIFYYDEDQHVAARAARNELDGSGELHRPVATEISPVPTFWRAEDYHQRYFEKQGVAGCTMPG